MAASGTSLQPESVGGAMTMPATGSSGPGAQTPTPAARLVGRGGAHLGRERLDLGHDRLRPAAGERRRGREGEQPAGVVHQGGAQLGPAEVDGERDLGHRAAAT